MHTLKHEDGKKYFSSFSFITWSLLGFFSFLFFFYQYNIVFKITNSGAWLIEYQYTRYKLYEF